MKRLVCEMCGGSDLVKQDGVFVCQNCGTKYSVEEAKKMMVEGAVTVEGTVAVEGTVKVDKSKELENLYVLARRAKEADNTDNACRYYTQIEMQDPNSWEAYFYLIYFKARTTKIADIPKDCKNLANSFGTTLDLLFKSNNEEEDVRKALNMIFEDIKYIADLMFNSINTLTSGEYSSEALLDSFQYKEPVLSMMDKLGESIATHKQYADIAVQVWKSEIELFMSYYGSSTRYDAVKGTYAYFVKGSTTMLGYSGVPVTYLITDVPKKIHEFDLSYEDPFGITKKLRRNEKFITCPKCGATMRERESKCPQCGTPKEEIQRLIAEKEAAEAAERERLRKEREAKEAEEARIRAEKRAEWWAANKRKVGIAFLVIIAIIGILVTIIKFSNAVAKNRDKGTVQQNEKIDYSSVGRRVDASYENIQSVLISLSANGSKSGNPYRLASLFTETVNPYVKEGNSKNSQDIPEAMRQFLERYDYYEVSSPNDLNVQSRGSGYIATYNIIVEWNSERTGHKRACIQKTAYFNNECKITGFIDQELWRESVADHGYWEVLSDRKLVESDLRGKSADELSIMRNSIYARHGYRFKKQKYLDYFGQFDWYRPNTDNQQVAFNRMSNIEQYNVNFIREHE